MRGIFGEEPPLVVAGGLGVVSQGGVDTFFCGVEKVLFGRFGSLEQITSLPLRLLTSVVDGGTDLLLDLEEGAGLAGELHFVEDGLHQFAEQGRVEGLDEVFQHASLPGMGSAQTMFERRTRGRSAAGVSFQAFWARSQRERPAIWTARGSMSTPWMLCSMMSRGTSRRKSAFSG